MADAQSSELRASDAERDAVVDQLGAAAGEGRLTLDELGQRSGQALEATTRGDLEQLLGDLPQEPIPDHSGKGARNWIVAVMGDSTHKGRWRVGETCTVVNVMGGADLDFTQAIVENRETVIRDFSLMGGSDYIFPESLDVEVSGFALMGGNDIDDDAPPPPPGAPRVRIIAYSLMGGLNVKRRRTRRELRD